MSIKIKECHEPLVDLKKCCPGLVIQLGQRRMKKEKTAYLRKSVAEKLMQAKKLLPTGMTFLIRDAWRPQAVQEEIFKKFIKNFSKKNPGWSKGRIIKFTQKFVAPAKGPNFSGHLTGGAVDLRLIKNNRKVPMRSRKLNYEENSLPIQPKLPQYIQKNRKILFDALKAVGLVNNPREFWHWSYGDIQWAERTKRKIAKYGIIKILTKTKL